MKLIPTKWPAPNNIHAFTTTRIGGTSQAPFDSLNLAKHVGDDTKTVQHNRKLLREAMHLPNEPHWLEQTHSTMVSTPENKTIHADASYTNQANDVCVVMTADCLPVLVCSTDGKEVAAIHAGWRGLANGVIENTLDCFQASPEQLIAWLAPAIQQPSFEVGEDVYDVFFQHTNEAKLAFKKSKQGKYLADLYLLARQRLTARGVTQVYQTSHCTYQGSDLFFSYRRDKHTGRIASLIWRSS